MRLIKKILQRKHKQQVGKEVNLGSSNIPEPLLSTGACDKPDTVTDSSNSSLDTSNNLNVRDHPLGKNGEKLDTLPEQVNFEVEDLHSSYSKPVMSVENSIQEKIQQRRDSIQNNISGLIELVYEYHKLGEITSSVNDYFLPDEHDMEQARDHDYYYSMIRGFIESFPSNYALEISDPKEVLMHMNLFKSVQKRGSYSSAVNISSFLSSSSSTESDNAARTIFFDEVFTGLVVTPITNEANGVRPHRRHYIHSITIVCKKTAGLLEYVMGLLESGGSEILDCSVYLTKDHFFLIRAIIYYVKGGLHLNSLQDYVDSFIQAAYGLPIAKKISIPTSARFGTPDPKTPRIHTRNRDHVITDDCIGTLRLFDPYTSDKNLDQDTSNSGCPFLSRQKRLHEAYFDQPKLLCDIIRQIDSLGPFPSNQDDSTSDAKSSTEHKSDGQHQIRGHVATRRRKLVRRSCSIDLSSNIPASTALYDADSSSHSISSRASYSSALADTSGHSISSRVSFNSALADTSRHSISSRNSLDIVRSAPSAADDPTHHIFVTATIQTDCPVSIYQGFMAGDDYDSYIHKFHSDKTSFENQSGLIAIKVADSSSAVSDPAILNNLAEEGEVVKKLDHPNICRLVSMYRSSSLVFLAYEYCSKGSLCSIICDESKCYDYLPLAIDVAQGMAYLHSKRIIHRDLKPSNIFVDRNNTARVADFSISTTHNGDELSGETGTYRWMAPEVIRHEPYSNKADVYSYGICLWQLVTRSPQPFKGMSPLQAAFAVTKGERPLIPSSVPDFVRQIIISCWDEDQHKRPTFTNISMALSAYANISTALDFCI